MRWPTIDVPDPKAGTVRCKQFFCWSPTRIGNQTYWLETVIVKQVWHVMQTEGAFHGWWNECIWGEDQ